MSDEMILVSKKDLQLCHYIGVWSKSLLEAVGEYEPDPVAAVPVDPPAYALDILKRVRDGELSNCLAYRMIIEGPIGERD